MTFDDFDAFVQFITPLAMHFGAVKDEPTWRLYHAALMVTPAPSRYLLDRALPRAASSRRWFPTVDELRADAEAERQAVLRERPHERCEACRGSSGFVAVKDDDGVTRMKRCGCFDAYLQSLEQLGVGAAVLALPVGRDDEHAGG